MAAMAAVGATSTALTTFHFARLPSLSIHRIALPTLSLRLHASLGSQKVPEPENNASHDFQVFFPWLLQGHAGDFAVHALPAARSLHAVADGGAPKKVKGNAVEVKKKKSSEEPRHSKAARRFYNERFREPPQRIAKVLASAGGEANLNFSCDGVFLSLLELVSLGGKIIYIGMSSEPLRVVVFFCLGKKMSDSISHSCV